MVMVHYLLLNVGGNGTFNSLNLNSSLKVSGTAISNSNTTINSSLLVSGKVIFGTEYNPVSDIVFFSI